MNDMSNEARRITFELNNAYHTPEEVRNLLSRLFGKTVDESFRVSLHFILTLVKTLQWGKMYSLMPAVIFKTTEEYL